MKPLAQPRLTRKLGRGQLVVDGGWTAYVPEIEPDPDSLAVYARYLGGKAKARAHLQRVFEMTLLRHLRETVRRWAHEYLREFPDLAVFDPTTLETRLKGFDPAALIGYYVPLDVVGRRGKGVRRALMLMGREARKLQKDAGQRPVGGWLS